MEQMQRVLLAREALARRAEQCRYVVTWRSNDASHIYYGTAGFKQLASELHVTELSLRNYISRGKGAHNRTGMNPLTNEPDILTVTRLDPPAKPKRPRGRPPKARDWERLGSEAPANPTTGTDLAPPAKSVPKTRIRATARNKGVSIAPHTEANSPAVGETDGADRET